MRFAFILLMVIGMRVFAQTNYNDAQVWFNLYLEKKVSKKFLLHLNQQDRWTNNVSQYTLGYADVGVTYKITKDVKVLLDYVFTQKRKEAGYFGTRHQYYVAVVLKKDWARWRLSYRNLFQVQYNNPYTSEHGYFPYFHDRNKFILKYYATRRFDFYVAEELYIPLNNEQVKGIDRSRTFAGLFYNITKRQQLELYFLYQSQLQKGDWYKQQNKYPNDFFDKFYVYGIGYSIQF